MSGATRESGVLEPVLTDSHIAVTVRSTLTLVSVLERAAVDMDFMAELAKNPEEALREYPLTMEEKAAIGSGDIARIEGWVGKLTPEQSKWLWARLQQEQW